ncbi:hypothetical protein RFI_08221 [Reticulomyxa filosa]|uniref:adenosine deaminase n=1 Tax=Reticulomyxa filosa TaxID=46433 RepID=X6NSF4_RETFI|nr:hypothetical protein RFI_08221 [Reticulomyxa filosa]|eukprot:ETO28906.1 hypothetical protein RFI_08221 [Reticulomyxa filosa]
MGNFFNKAEDESRAEEIRPGLQSASASTFSEAGQKSNAVAVETAEELDEAKTERKEKKKKESKNVIQIESPRDSSNFYRVELVWKTWDVYGDDTNVQHGSVNPKILYEAAKRNHPSAIPKHVKTLEDFIPLVTCLEQSAHLEEVLDKMEFYMAYLIDDKRAIIDMCKGFVKQQYEQQIYYTETRYSPHLLCSKVLTPEEVLVTILDALHEASQSYGITVKSILCCMRNWKGGEKAQEVVDLAIKYQSKGVVGVDLAGSEQAATSKEYKEFFDQVKNVKGLHITIHAGEACGPESVKDALHNLHAERIGHGYRATEDEDVMKELRPIFSHFCNCQEIIIITRAVRHIVLKDKDWSRHPIAIFAQKGVSFGINTDDPCVMATDYSHEVETCSQLIRLDEKTILQSFVNSARATFLNGEEKEKLVKTIEERVNKRVSVENISRKLKTDIIFRKYVKH